MIITRLVRADFERFEMLQLLAAQKCERAEIDIQYKKYAETNDLNNNFKKQNKITLPPKKQNKNEQTNKKLRWKKLRVKINY